MTSHPFPVKFNDAQRDTVETIKAALHGFPKYSEILRAALDIGLKQMATMTADELAKQIRG